MLPLARTALRRIGTGTDVVTYVSRYTRGRFASAFGPRRRARAPTARRGHRAVRARRGRRVPNCGPATGSGERPVVVCVSRLVPRKGQDMLIRAMPAIRAARPRRRTGDRRRRPVPDDPAPAGAQTSAWPTTWCSPTGCRATNCPHTTPWPTCSRCRAAPAAPGLDVEGLGIVYLEASATGVPVVAGRLRRRTRDRAATARPVLVVDGWDVGAIAASVSDLLADPDRAARMGAAGRRWVVDNWQWRTLAQRLAELL